MSDSSNSEISDSPESTLAENGPASSNSTVQLTGFQLWLSNNKEFAFRMALLAFVLGFVIFATVLWLTDSLSVENAGYGGVWIVSFIAAGSIVLPIPGPAVVCLAAAPDLGMTPLLIGFVSATAEALGEMTGYIAGLSGRSLLERNRFYPKVRGLVMKRGGIILFFGAVIPNPLFDVIGIAAGSIGYPVKKFLVIVFFAKMVKSTSIAYACLWGIDWIMGLFG
jgi:membrane protein YqaA with SNARE-associated domain